MPRFYKFGFLIPLFLALQLTINISFAQCPNNTGLTVSPSSVSVCSGISVPVTIVSSEIGVQYQLQNNADSSPLSGLVAGTGGDIIIDTNPITSNTTVKIYANTCGLYLTQKVTITLSSSPAITTQPLASQSVCEGSAASFSVTATGTGLGYQWKKNGVDIGGATASSYNIPSTVSSDGATYTVSVTGTCSPVVTSNGSVLTIKEKPEIITQPASTQTVCAGQSVSFSVDAGVTTLPTYQWYKGASPIGGATSSSYSIASTLVSDAATYSVVISGSCTPTATSSNSVLNVNQLPTSFASPQSICSGQTTSVNITNPNGVSGTSFSWSIQSSNNVSGGFSDSGNIIAQVLTATDGVSNGSITYQITASAAGCSGPPFGVTINVAPIPNASAPALSQICSGTMSNVPILNPNSVANTTFSWSVFSSVNVSGASSGNGSLINQVLNSTDGVSAGYVVYTITPWANGCSGSAITARVDVKPVPVITDNPSSLTQSICSGATLNYLPSFSIGGTIVNWTSVTSGSVSGASSIGNSSITNTLVNTGNVTGIVAYHITPSLNSCSGQPVDFVVNVKPIPNASATSPQNICSGSETNIVINNPNNVSGTHYTWVTSSPSNVSGASSGSGSIINQLLTSTDGVNTGSVSYDVTPIAANCSGNQISIIVNVGAKPVITTSAATLIKQICSGNSLNFIPTSTIAGTTYYWSSTIIGSVTGVSSTGSGIITDTPVNSGNTAAVIIYKITPVNGTCEGDPVNMVVTVNPRPDVAGTPSSQVICSGQSTSIALSNPSNVTGTTFTWTILGSPSNITGGSAGSGNVISQNLNSSDGLNSGTITYRIRATANGCNGSPGNVLVTVNPVPSITTSSSGLSVSICSGDVLNFIPSSTISGTTYTWTSTVSGSISTSSVTASGSSVITDIPINSGNTNGIVTYHIIPHYNSCDGTAVDYVVTVKPLPSATSANVIICSGQNAVFSISNAPKNVSGTTYAWSISPSANVTGAASGNGSTINQLLNTTNSSTGSVIYHVIPSAFGCNGANTDLTATVNSPAGVNAGSDYSVCGDVSGIALTGNISGTAASGIWSVITGTGFVTANNTTGGVVTATYTIGVGDVGSLVTFRLTTDDPDASGPCSLATDDLIVSVHKPASLSIPGNFAVCESSPINLSGTLAGSATSGVWSLLSGSSTVGPTSVTGSTITAVYNPLPADISTIVKFRLTTNDPDGSGPCTTKFLDLNVGINPSAKVNAGVDFPVCEDKIVQLNGAFSGAATSITWSGGGGVSQYSNVNSPSSTYVLTPADISNGSILFTITSNDPDGAGPCIAASDQVVVKVNKLPQPQLFVPKSAYAENDPLVSLSGFPSGGIYSGPGVQPGTNMFDPAQANIGNNIVRYDYTSTTTGCSNFVTRSILVNQLTSIDFTIEGNTIDDNVGQEIFVCGNSGQHKMIGSPDVSTGIPVSDFKSSTSGLISKIGGQYYLETDGIQSGTYLVVYTYTNSSMATNTHFKNITIDAAPVAKMLATNDCVTNSVPFNDASTFAINDNNTFENITAWKWDFGDGTPDDTNQNTTHTFAQSKNYSVILTAYTNKGCSDTTKLTIRIGRPPVVDFSWANICTVNPTQFKSAVHYGISTRKNFSWDFGDGTSPTPLMDTLSTISTTPMTSGVYGAPTHKYATHKQYNVTLTVETNDGCIASKTNKVYVQDYKVLDIQNSYYENFDGSQSTWIKTSAASDTSWILGTPHGETINKARSGSNAWWTGKNNNIVSTSTYFDNEKSEVVGPCLNLTNLERPMVSIDYWSDMQNQFDGAVLQYSIDGGKTWSVIGNEKGAGIDWYNYAPIGANPGNQPIGQTGWTNATDGWKNARYNLDEIPMAERDLVLIRVAFASNNDNPSERKLNGFAFDDVYIGEKRKNVLVEHFTNSSNLNVAQYLDNLFDRQTNPQVVPFKEKSDFIKIQYHLANPEPDQINKDNPLDPATRALLYSVSQPPYSVMNGVDDTYFLSAEKIDSCALTDPLFNIEIENLHSDNNALIANVKITYIDTLKSLQNAVNVHSVLIESNVGVNRNVVRKLLPQREGKLLSGPWASNRSAEMIPINYTPDVKIENPDNLYLVTFVQDKGTREIYQSYTVKAPRLVGQQIVGLPDSPAMAEVSDIHIYPNPAKGVINFELYTKVNGTYSWELIDQRGVSVLNGSLNKNTEEIQQINVSSLADGIYFVMIKSESGLAIYRKVAIMN